MAEHTTEKYTLDGVPKELQLDTVCEKPGPFVYRFYTSLLAERSEAESNTVSSSKTQVVAEN